MILETYADIKPPHKDAKFLKTMRAQILCEWCRSWEGCHIHHIFGRGQRSWKRLDLPIAVVRLCPKCHAKTHGGNILRCDLLAVVATREGCLQGDIEETVYAILQRSKKGNVA